MSSLRPALLCALPLLVVGLVRTQDLNLTISERPQYLDALGEPTSVYFTLSVMFLGDIREPSSSFAVDTFVDVAWRDDRLGYSAQAFACTKPSVGIPLLVESYAPSVCPDLCLTSSFCSGGATPPPWSPFLEVTNVAPASAGSALSFPTAYVRDSSPPRLNLALTEGTWALSSARFSAPILKVYPLQDFPYDRQQLDIYVESNAWPIEDVILVPSFSAAEIQATIERSKSMLGWDVESVSISAAPHAYATLNLTFHRISISVVVRRQPTLFTTRFVLIAFFVVIMMLFGSMHAEAITRVGAAITGFASILYLQFILGSLVPPLNYLTRIDKFMILALIICFICSVIGGAHSFREALARRAKEALERDAKKKDAPSTDASGSKAAAAGGAPIDIIMPVPSSASTSGEGGNQKTPSLLVRLNPFSGGSLADTFTYGLIFVAFSIATPIILLA